MMQYRTICAFILWISYSHFTDAACNLPDAFGSGTDQWLDSYFGQLTINTTDMGVPGPLPGQLIPLTCDVNSGSKYVMRSPPLYFGDPESVPTMNLLMCLDMTRVTDNKFVYYFGTELDPNLDIYMVMVLDGTEADITSVCTATKPYSVGTYQMLLRADSLGSENITCDFEGLYSYTLDDAGSRMCNDSLLDGCANPYALHYTDRGCNGDASSIVNCIYTMEDENARYLTTFKNDSTLDVQERFQCHIFERNNDLGSTFSSSRSSGSCNSTQTFDFNPNDQIIVYTRYDDCIPDTTTVAETTTMEDTTATTALTTTDLVAESTEIQTTPTTSYTTAQNTEAITELPSTSATDLTSTTFIVTTDGITQKVTESVSTEIEATTPQPTTEVITDKITEPVTDAPTTTVTDIPEKTTEASHNETPTEATSTIKLTPPYIPDNKGTTLNAYAGEKIVLSLLVMVLVTAFQTV